MKSRFLSNVIRETAACNPGMVFVNLQSSSIICPLGSTGGSFFIMVDKKLLTNSCKDEDMVQIPIKYDQISQCISNYYGFCQPAKLFHYLLFENQVCWKVDFCLTLSGTLSQKFFLGGRTLLKAAWEGLIFFL